MGWFLYIDIQSRVEKCQDNNHNDTQHNDIQLKNKLNTTLNLTTLLCWVSFMQSVNMLNVAKEPIMPSVILLSVVTLSVVAPKNGFRKNTFFSLLKLELFKDLTCMLFSAYYWKISNKNNIYLPFLQFYNIVLAHFLSVFKISATLICSIQKGNFRGAQNIRETLLEKA